MGNERRLQLRQEAAALINKGGLSAKIGHAFLRSNNDSPPPLSVERQNPTPDSVRRINGGFRDAAP